MVGTGDDPDRLAERPGNAYWVIARPDHLTDRPPDAGAKPAADAGPGTEPYRDRDLHAMALALAEARAGADQGEVPVGAVVLAGGKVLASRHNEREQTGDPTAHAELLALRDAAVATGGWRLNGVTVVVTLEPCAMCAGALVAARVGRLVYGAADPRAGACGTLYNLCADPRLNHELPVTRGVAAEECGALLTSFFARKRPGGTPEASGPGHSD